MTHWALSLLLACGVSAALSPEARSGKAKYDLIMDNKARPGSTLFFTTREIEELAKLQIPEIVPEGFREPHLTLGAGTAEGTALIDFKRLRHAQGAAPSWLDALIEGERPVRVLVNVWSAAGKAKVELKRLEISKIAATGRVLDLLVKSFFLPLFPHAKINEPFDLENRVDHVDVRPNGVYVTIKK